WRFREPSFPARYFAVPRWDGSPLAGQTILLHAEQGLGDAIQFLRYAPLVKQRGGTVLVLCPPTLVALAATCSGVDAVSAGGQISFDAHASLMSLPAILGTTLSTIPATIPYLTPDPGLVAFWRNELARETRLKVGMIWQGNARAWNADYRESDRLRSAPLSAFAALAQVPGVALFSLQFGEGSEQVATASFPITDWGKRSAPLDNLAAMLVNLDLLVTVDTGPGHLAGALGVPTWIALSRHCCWRWLLNRSDSLWYPRHRLFRQKQAGAWGPVFEEMASELHAWVSRR